MKKIINNIIRNCATILWERVAPKGTTMRVEREFGDVWMEIIHPFTAHAIVTFRKEGCSDITFKVGDVDKVTAVTALTDERIYIRLYDDCYSRPLEDFAKSLVFSRA